MDRATNPYTPNAGAPPPFLAGRGMELEEFRLLLRRLANGYTEKSLVVTGLRGVGKTVLLLEYQKSRRRRTGLQSTRRSPRTRHLGHRWQIWPDERYCAYLRRPSGAIEPGMPQPC